MKKALMERTVERVPAAELQAYYKSLFWPYGNTPSRQDRDSCYCSMIVARMPTPKSGRLYGNSSPQVPHQE
ncbi:unnamed protein product [Periconia digitata]|uniref:Uncharacterized protein n=1 Tax=Periconia digitata TaxID=1303443 RepID=A0A9W4UV25_9PLEO|nr:unnamed protein product [Periconia digitata]